jgi:hypothetical protein
MSQFTLTIDLGNDAMSTPSDIADALRKLAGRIETIDGYLGDGVVRDVNGNTVGHWALES